MNSNDIDFRTMAVDTIGKDLLGALVTELKLLPKVWNQIPEAKQNEILDRLRKRVSNGVQMAVFLISSQGRKVVVGELDQITVKNGAKAVVNVAQTQEGFIELCQAQGHAVMIVVSDPEGYDSGMDSIRGESDQRAMDLGHEYHDNDGGGMDDANVVDASWTPAGELPAPGETTVTEEEREDAFEEGYDAAVNGKPQSDCPITKHELVTEWMRGWKAWHEEQGDGTTDTPEAEGDE